jgi:peptidoglycan/xylan/chitin deacetylase (PgdA/CDA1 family)
MRAHRSVFRILATGLILIALLPLSPPALAQVIKGGSSTCPAVALTYDLCPVRNASGFDAELIDYLIDHHIPATFFVSGRWMVKHEAQMRKLLAVPFFEIGTHGDVHAHLAMQDADEQRKEVVGPVRILKTKYGQDASMFRPPYGEYNDVTVEVVKALGLRFILWNIESGDPDPTLTAEAIVGRVQKRLKPGSVIVLHANGKGKHTKEVTDALVTTLLPHKGLTALTVSKLLSCDQPQARIP